MATRTMSFCLICGVLHGETHREGCTSLEAELQRSVKKDLTPEATPATVQSSVINTLNERGSRYGKFSDHAHITQLLKTDMQSTNGWERLTAGQKEALEMIAHKIGRILNGDPNYADSWHDISGYATLVERKLNGEDI